MANIAYKKIFNGYKYNYIGLTEKKILIMDNVNVQIYKNDIGKLIFVKKNIDLIEILRKIFFVPPLFFI